MFVPSRVLLGMEKHMLVSRIKDRIYCRSLWRTGTVPVPYMCFGLEHNSLKFQIQCLGCRRPSLLLARGGNLVETPWTLFNSFNESVESTHTWCLWQMLHDVDKAHADELREEKNFRRTNGKCLPETHDLKMRLPLFCSLSNSRSCL